jgi:serine protease Do
MRLLLFALIVLPAAAQELTGAQLVKLKDATVFVKHVAFRGLETGSGYLFRKDGRVGWILTCEHVVRGADRPTVVLRSGRTGELKAEARVMVADRERDLAVLRIVADDLPAAVELGARTEVKETETVFVAGFPFGPQLATAGDNPAPSVTKVSVSSVRRDEAGEAVIVQLSGDVNAGNSGGPAVDARGRFVGLAQSRVQGTEMVFTVPPEALRFFVKGRILQVAGEAAESPEGRATVRVTAAPFDPLGKLQTWGVAWVRRDAVKEAPAAGADGKWRAAGVSMKEVALKADEETGVSTGSLDLSRASGDGDGVEVLLQAWWVGADGVKSWGEPAAAVGRFGVPK